MSLTTRKQQAGGKVTKAKGRVRAAVGKLTGNRKTQARGAAEKMSGSVKSGIGKLRQKAENLAKWDEKHTGRPGV